MSDRTVSELADTIADHLALTKERVEEMISAAYVWRCKGDCDRRAVPTWAEWSHGRAVVHTCPVRP